MRIVCLVWMSQVVLKGPKATPSNFQFISLEKLNLGSKDVELLGCCGVGSHQCQLDSTQGLCGAGD